VENLEEGVSLLETDRTARATMNTKNQFHRSTPTATTEPNPAPFLDHNLLPRGTTKAITKTGTISQEATGVIGNMTNSEAIKEETTIEEATEEEHHT